MAKYLKAFTIKKTVICDYNYRKKKNITLHLVQKF